MKPSVSGGIGKSTNVSKFPSKFHISKIFIISTWHEMFRNRCDYLFLIMRDCRIYPHRNQYPVNNTGPHQDDPNGNLYSNRDL